MTQTKLFEYFGANGIILGPVELMGVAGAKKLKLTADEGCLLTRDDKNFYTSVVIPETEFHKWKEVARNAGNEANIIA